MDEEEWDTGCPATIMKCGGRSWIQGVHCECWYDGDRCCNCGDPAVREVRDEEEEDM